MSPQTVKLILSEKKALEKIQTENLVDYIQLIHFLKISIKKLNFVLKSLKKKKLIDIKKEPYYNEIKLTSRALSVNFEIAFPSTSTSRSSNQQRPRMQRRSRQSESTPSPTGYPEQFRLTSIKLVLKENTPSGSRADIKTKIRNYLGFRITLTSNDYPSSLSSDNGVFQITGSSGGNSNNVQLDASEFTALMLWFENYGNYISKIKISFLYFNRSNSNRDASSYRIAVSDMYSSAPLNLLREMISAYPENLKFKEIELKISYDVSDGRVSILKQQISQLIGVNPRSKRGNDERSIYVRNENSGPEITEIRFKEFMEFLRIEYPDQIFEIFLKYTYGTTSTRNYRTLYRSGSTSPMNELEMHLTISNYQIETLFNDLTPVRIEIEYDSSIENEDLRNIMINLDFQYLEPSMIIPDNEEEDDIDDEELSKVISIDSVPINNQPMVEPLNHSTILHLIDILDSYNSSVSSSYRNKITGIYCRIWDENARSKRFRASNYVIGNETTEPLNKLKHWLSNTNWPKTRKRKKTTRRRRK